MIEMRHCHPGSFGRSHATGGFTLVEILVAISIFGLIMATILGAFTGITSSSRRAESKVDLYQTGRALMDIISADIRGIYRRDVEGAGPFFIGMTEFIEDRSMSRMDFLTTNTLSAGLTRNPYFSETGYRVKKNMEENRYSLWRRSQSPPEYPYEEGGREIPVCRIIESFRLEFIFNNDKRDSLSYAIPASVVIDFTLDQSGEKERFVTMVRPMINN